MRVFPSFYIYQNQDFWKERKTSTTTSHNSLMSKSPWGKIGAWAADAERADAEEREAAAAEPPASFPSLKEAVTTPKQKKKTKMSLHEFRMQQSTYFGSEASSRGLTPEEMLRLPTGPKERSADEMQYGRGGGFSNYGSLTGSGGSNARRSREYEGRRSFGFDDDGRKGTPQESRVSDFNQPSRADEVENWASMKKQTLPEYNQERPNGKYSSSRADEVDNWASVKRSLPQTQQTRSSSFGQGFSRPEQGFGSGFSRPEPDRWTRNEHISVTDSRKNKVEVVPKVNRPSPFGAARPREEVLADKGLDWKKLDAEIEVKKLHYSVSGGSRPMSSHSSRPNSQQSSKSDVVVSLGGEGLVKEKPKVNPFGDAKPREVLLEEKGLDWKKIDLDIERRRVERPETEDEKNLKEKIEHLKKELLTKIVEDKTSRHDLVRQREHDLELLVRRLDDKVRYSQKVFERKDSTGPSFNERPPSRPGSYEGQPRAGSLDRPPSRPGSFEDYRPRSRHGAYEDFTRSDRPRSRPGAHEEPREVDYNEMPRLQGSVNSWLRPNGDGRFYQGGGGRGFLGGREMDRSGSRW